MAYILLREKNTYQVVIVDRLLPGVRDHGPPEQLGLLLGPILLDEALARAGLCRHSQVYVVGLLIRDGIECGGGTRETLRGQGLVLQELAVLGGCRVLLSYMKIILLTCQGKRI